MRAVVCVLLCGLACALPASSGKDAADSVVLVPSSTECDINTEITVSYQRVSNDRDDAERSDFVGLFRKADPTGLVPYDVALVGEVAQTGSVMLRCRKAGEMQVRMIRNPANIIGSADVTVFAPCPSADCSGHGTCAEGACTCEAGWEGPACDLLTSEGTSVGWLGHENAEFYFGDSVVAKVFHSATEVKSSGSDMIAVVRVDNANYAYSSAYIPTGDSQVEVPLPSNPGKYMLELRRGQDGEVLAASEHFGIFAPCPAFCSYHGSCEAGKCVCDSGFDRDDCSRGAGVVTVTFTEEAYSGAVLTADFTRDETVKGVLTDLDWVGIYKAADESCDNPEYFAYAISDKVYDPDVAAKIKTNVTHGTVQLLAPLEPGQYVLKYVRADHAKYHVTPPFEIFSPCPRNCSEHGHCAAGKCVCSEGWTANDCSEGTAAIELAITKRADELYVGDSLTAHFLRPAGKHSNFDFVGVYGRDSANNSDKLYGYAYAIANGTEDSPREEGDVELVLPAAGQLTLRYVNAYSLETEMEIASPFTVYDECPNECSGNGKCVAGKCECGPQWKGDDCAKGAGIVTLGPAEGSPVTVKPGHVGFLVHVKRPVNHYTAGDFVGLFPASGPYEADHSIAYSYAKFEDEADVFMILSTRTSGAYLVKYFNPAHEELGSSDNFELVFEEE